MNQPKKVIAGSLLIVIFVLMVSLSSWYVQNEIYLGDVCSCAIPLPILIPVLASIGLLVGTLVYYMFSPSFEKAPVCKESILKLLDPTERQVMNILIENNGEAVQSRIVQLTSLSKVTVFRSLEKLKSKGIIEKKKHGKTNRIMLAEDIMRIFE